MPRHGKAARPNKRVRCAALPLVSFGRPIPATLFLSVDLGASLADVIRRDEATVCRRVSKNLHGGPCMRMCCTPMASEQLYQMGKEQVGETYPAAEFRVWMGQQRHVAVRRVGGIGG